ncbi:MAG: preprotein translocase subunit SecA [Candidatus Colwellbacteria bacterium GWA2_46_10]|uniref:Protein translocase subunit SecA n=1 Tax=Candidatus Colwellbacteria bacterium GWA2_46_10 TaxID=1797684 RepID=A0A1G1YUX9_9BACT|nr:MAG: Protein translocase subunit SecA [Parcubacteria group bacterium GW2011_GWA2_46_10]OGY56175.1 MAG: preprotein translocase subunit SecA [Candidatus Colwellbacteria bacterium GWA2_46_10]
MKSVKDLGRRIFGARLPKQPKEIEAINALEEELSVLGDDGLKEESLKLQKKAKGGESLDELLVRAFALVRESAKRKLGQRPYDVQLWGGLVMHQRGIAEMMTGEGKTLAATAPVYLNALNGKGVHIVTVNDYLAKRDTVWMGQIYYALGLQVACLVHDAQYMYDPDWKLTDEEEILVDKERDEMGSFEVREEFLRPISRREAYAADIVYGTNHEFGFDYLRDNLRRSKEEQVQRPLHFAIIDEVDSILIDEARTPLIISFPDSGSSDYYRVFADAVKKLKPEEDYVVDEKLRSVEITEVGIDKIEGITGVKDLYAPSNLRLAHYLEASLKARALYERDTEYVVKNGEIIIVDQFTGRLMPGRRYSGGIHQAIEAKEGVAVQDESRTFAQITIQNYFRLYQKLAGMTGTAQTSAEEFHKVYGLEVATIPTHNPLIREDREDFIYKNLDAKYRAIIGNVKECHEKGQPILIGTVSIEKNEVLSGLLSKAGIPHEVLNAKNHEREGAIIAQAGHVGAVTVATNMAGRGVDIILGGRPFDQGNYEKVKGLGGLHVIGTERHEARRIDNQLRGRSGRQGDPGSSQFFLSLEDDLMRIFGGDRIKGIMERFDLPEDHPIQNRMVSRSLVQAQSKVEGFNFDSRKHLLDYDDIINKQRLTFYDKRQRILTAIEEDGEYIRHFVEENFMKQLDELKSVDVPEERKKAVLREIGAPVDDLEKAGEMAKVHIEKFEGIKMLGVQLVAIMDLLWMNHLEDIEALRESVRIRAYGQRDPLVEYRRESKMLFDQLEKGIEGWIFAHLFKLKTEKTEEGRPTIKLDVANKKVGRNDPCPCGSGKKYKKCHGK